jgi:hypothetical protein
MTREFRSTSDVIIRSSAWDRALDFYGSLLSLPEVYRSGDWSASRRGPSFCILSGAKALIAATDRYSNSWSRI